MCLYINLGVRAVCDIDVTFGSEVVFNLIMAMKILVWFSIALPLATVGINATASRIDLHNYISMTSDIRMMMQDMSILVSVMSNNVLQMTNEFYGTIDPLIVKYGPSVAQHYEMKYRSLVNIYGTNLQVHKDCKQYILNLLRDNQQHQVQLAQYRAKAEDAWALQISRMFYIFKSVRTVLSNLETAAYKCGFEQPNNQQADAVGCAAQVFHDGKNVESTIVGGIFEEISALLVTQNTTMRDFRQSLADRFIPDFYREYGHDAWLRTYCWTYEAEQILLPEVDNQERR